MHKTIDKVLAYLMKLDGLSQTDLSRATKVTQGTISRILNPNGPKGIKSPTDKQVKPIADHFGISTDQLRGYDLLPDKPATGDMSRDPEQSGTPAMSGRVAIGMALFDRATPKSQAIIDRIASLDAQGKLTSEDLQILETIIERFGSPR